MLYSLKTTQDSILSQTRFYSRQTTQDFYTHHTHKKDFYTHHRQHTDFYTRHGQHNICIFDRQVKILYSPQTTQNSILITDHTNISIFTTDDTRFLYSSRTTQDFYSRRYTRHGEHKILFCQRQYKILYSSPTTQDFILVISNTRFYTCYRQHKIQYLSQTTQDSILVTDNPRFLYSLWTIQHFYSRHYTRNGEDKILYSSQTT